MSFLKTGSIYLISNIVNKAIPFMLLPILTRYLSQAEYGQIAMFQLLITALSALAGFGVVGASARKFYDQDITPDDLKDFNGACFQILFISTIIISPFTLFFYKELSDLLAIPAQWVFASLAIASLGFIIQIRLSQWQVRGQAKQYGMLQIASSLINVVFSLLLVITLNLGPAGRVDAQLITVLIMSLLTLYYLKLDNLVNFFTFKPMYIKEALNFGVPLIPHIIGIFLLSSVDRYIINSKLGLESAAIYMVSYQLSSALAIVFDAISKAYTPWLFTLLKKDVKEEKLRVVKGTYLYMAFLVVLAILSFVIGPPVVVFVAGEKYAQASSIIGYLCMGQIFGGMHLMVSTYVFFSKKTQYLSLVTIISGVINVVIMLLLVEYNGLVGVAQAFAIAQFLRFLSTWMLAAKVQPMPWFTYKVMVN
ncbi:lipopolysaccharide biosynthesis protein [Paraglaciecola sp. MB-3u-78]|jgi:O-antigen/teichoic acid export membrane protein|uniref:lipopolysaccharide biosynthesis protein n=1 Tax=Paraglaciecola sp. MB-3u-78 TaxID=2058332 RepID=UPI000C34B322|nr:oligosaccharide flippase family protein [Paraglaciecola sp. MB-3u-78]PKG98919.1 polysaccharide biosynthesis protein [Paraglaciecola sp. MB-3u-78]